MKEKKDIICISNTTWHGEFTKSTVQLMSRLAKNNRVLFVEYAFTWKDIFTTFIGKRNAPVKRMLGLKSRLTTIRTDQGTDVFHLVVPPVFPVDFIKNDKLFSFFFGLNITSYKRTLKRTLRKIGFTNPLNITAYNSFYGLPLINKLSEALNVYYCYDGLNLRRHGKRILKIDEEFSRKVDAVIVTSDFLKASKEKFNSNSFVVKNGVDFNVFYASAKKDLTKNKRKKVGYIGSLDRRFDIDTLEYAVRQLPDYDFHITGNLRNLKIKERLGPYSNVEFSPPVKPHEVPALLATYDAGIIPYIANELNKNIYPLKINEYLAVGVPIVMTAFADLPDFDGVISVAATKENFVQMLKKEIRNDSKEMIASRIKFAENNSWENKAFEFNNLLDAFLKEKTLSKNE
ncbi:glycosyltransferase [Marinifilum sp. RC60d5]|uniref:glycosyltransferase n=1 Tax=Marinifilum sp. RC60d5 TaxID=3458414 RepID=UPI00403501BB